MEKRTIMKLSEGQCMTLVTVESLGSSWKCGNDATVFQLSLVPRFSRVWKEKMRYEVSVRNDNQRRQKMYT